MPSVFYMQLGKALFTPETEALIESFSCMNWPGSLIATCPIFSIVNHDSLRINQFHCSGWYAETGLVYVMSVRRHGLMIHSSAKGPNSPPKKDPDSIKWQTFPWQL